jgi:hypothetical protein
MLYCFIMCRIKIKFSYSYSKDIQAKKKGGLCIDLNKNPRGKCRFGLLFKIHTQMLQHKAAGKKNKIIILNT